MCPSVHNFSETSERFLTKLGVGRLKTCWQASLTFRIKTQQNSTYPDAGYPDRLGPARKSVDNSTKVTCFEITGYRIECSAVQCSAVLWLGF
jgi:hypothetical protein